MSPRFTFAIVLAMSLTAIASLAAGQAKAVVAKPGKTAQSTKQAKGNSITDSWSYIAQKVPVCSLGLTYTLNVA